MNLMCNNYRYKDLVPRKSSKPINQSEGKYQTKDFLARKLASPRLSVNTNTEYRILIFIPCDVQYYNKHLVARNQASMKTNTNVISEQGVRCQKINQALLEVPTNVM